MNAYSKSVRCVSMGAQEEGLFKKKDFQKRSDEDIDAFLGRKDQPKPRQEPPAKPAVEEKPAKAVSEPEPAPAQKPEDTDEQIRMARTSRAAAEAYHDVAVLRKKAHMHSHQASKFFHRYRSNEEKAQKCSARAVSFREKSETKKEKARTYRTTMKELDSELKGAATGQSDLSPEAVRTKMATMERKAAKQEAVANKYEHKAAIQTEKAAKFRTRALRFLEKNKFHESEAKSFAKRADNLEKAGA